MKMYMGWDKQAGSAEGACLIFSESAKEARKLAYPVIDSWGSLDWIDVRVRLLKNHEELRCEAISDKPHVIESPKACHRCNQWGSGEELDDDGICETCLDLEM